MGDSEIRKHIAAVPVEQDVGRFDIEMQDRSQMSGAERLSQVGQQAPGLFGRQSSQEGPRIRQAAGREILDRSEAGLAIDVPVVELGDPVVSNGEQRRQLPFERVPGLGLVRPLHHFEGDEFGRRRGVGGVLGIQTAGEEHRAKTATPQPSKDAIAVARLEYIAGLRCAGGRGRIR